MRSGFSRLQILFPALLVLAGCGTYPDPAQNGTQAEELRVCGEAFLSGFFKNDDKSLYPLLPDGAARKYGKTEFEEIRKKLSGDFGTAESWRFLCSLETPSPLRTLIWAVRFRKRGLLKEEIVQERLFRVIIGKVDGRDKIFVFTFL